MASLTPHSSSPDHQYDIVIIGAGIVGLSTAWQMKNKYRCTRFSVDMQTRTEGQKERQTGEKEMN